MLKGADYAKLLCYSGAHACDVKAPDCHVVVRLLFHSTSVDGLSDAAGGGDAPKHGLWPPALSDKGNRSSPGITVSDEHPGGERDRAWPFPVTEGLRLAPTLVRLGLSQFRIQSPWKPLSPPQMGSSGDDLSQGLESGGDGHRWEGVVTEVTEWVWQALWIGAFVWGGWEQDDSPWGEC